MTRTSGRPTIDQGASEPTKGEGESDFAGPAGHASEKSEEPGDRERGEASSADAGVAIDLDSVHDRAS